MATSKRVMHSAPRNIIYVQNMHLKYSHNAVLFYSLLVAIVMVFPWQQSKPLMCILT